MKRVLLFWAMIAVLGVTPVFSMTDVWSNTIYVGVSSEADIKDGSEEYPFTTINDGINAAEAGDQIVVAPGTYNGQITINNRSGLTITGAGESTILQHSQWKLLITYSSNITVRGLNIRDGEYGASIEFSERITFENNIIQHLSQGNYDPGGTFRIRYSTDITVRGNRIHDNYGGQNSAGGEVFRSSVDYDDNLYLNNRAWNSGGGVRISNDGDDYTVRFRGNYFYNNTADYSGAIQYHGSGTLQILNNTFRRSGASFKQGGAIDIFMYNSNDVAEVRNNVIENMPSVTWPSVRKGVRIRPDSDGHVHILNNIIRGASRGISVESDVVTVVAEYNNLYGVSYHGVEAGPGSISADPLFVDPANGNHHLQTNSPCIDAGHPDPQYDDEDGSRNNMGAFGGPSHYGRPWITPPTADLISAEQTSTDGAGLVTVVVDVFDADPETLDIECLFSVDAGETWTNAWMQDASAEFGEVAVTNPGALRVLGVDVIDDGKNATNRLSMAWSTTHAPSVYLATGVLVRVRAWDGRFWSQAHTSTPFLVDNEPPSVPTGLLSSSHVLEVWSTDNTFHGEWAAADDGIGIGVAGYGVAMTDGMKSSPPEINTTGLTFTEPDLADGTNWWLAVRAVDAFGNAGDTVWLGPFLVDAGPPVATGAVIEISRSAFGEYTLSGNLTNTWSGFADNMSGIEGYYFSFENRGGTTEGEWTTNTSGILLNAVFDETNTVYVWARDVVGNIGPAAAASILVLDPDGDWDGTGMSNRQKEIAGLSAIDPDAVFAGMPVINPGAPDACIVHWPYAEGRVYTVYWSDSPLGPDMDWNSISNPDYSVQGDTASWTDPNPLNGPNGRRFYRVKVELE